MMEELAGDTVKAVGRAGPTVNGAFPLTVPDVAVMVTAPCFNVAASPVEEIVAMVGSELAQFTLASGAELPSENFPVALNCCVKPAATAAVWGDTATD